MIHFPVPKLCTAAIVTATLMFQFLMSAAVTVSASTLSSTTNSTANRETIYLAITSGNVTISPQGSSQKILVTGKFQLYPGDSIMPSPDCTGSFTVPSSGIKVPITANRPYRLSPKGLVDQNSNRIVLQLSSKSTINPPQQPSNTGDNNSPAAADTLPSETVNSADNGQKVLPSPLTVGGNITPSSGLVFLKDPNWHEFVKVPHRSSFSYGATIKCNNESKVELSTIDGRTLRIIGPAQVTVSKDNLIISDGFILVQSKHDKHPLAFETKEAKMSLKGSLLIINRDPAAATTQVRLLNGILSLQSQPSWKGEPWSTYLSANRQMAIVEGAKPAKAARFSSNDVVSPFIEGWHIERANTTIPAEFENDEVLSQLRADQAQKESPPDIRTSTNNNSPLNTAEWMRLRMRSTDNPLKRQHYVTFKRYVRARTKREKYEAELNGDSYPPARAENMTTRVKGYIPGGKTRTKDDAKLRLLRWHEYRIATQLAMMEQEFFNQDMGRGLRPDSFLFDKKRSVRERLYGEDLRMQTRRMISEALASMSQMSTRINDINIELASIPDTPANQDRIAELKAERSKILKDTDKLTDSVRAVIRLH